jgi:peptide-methionine (S)-S-oxide reductase
MKMTSIWKSAAGGVAAIAVAVAVGGALLGQGPTASAREEAVKIPAPVVDQRMTPGGGLETAILAGGCFWGVQGVFQHVVGVESAVSGYSGGKKDRPSYEQVTTGATGHAEAVEIKFDPSKITYGKILQIFFSVVHNPTQLNYQGPDHGTQYRSAIFTLNDEQKKVAEAYVAQLDKANVYPEKIVTEVTPASAFFAAEDYHQDYLTLHPNQPYIAYNDIPKVENLKAMFPEVWRDQPKLVFANNAS